MWGCKGPREGASGQWPCEATEPAGGTFQKSQAALADLLTSGDWKPLAVERFLASRKMKEVAGDRHFNGLPTIVNLHAMQSQTFRGPDNPSKRR